MKRMLFTMLLLSSCAMYQEEVIVSNEARPKDGTFRCAHVVFDEYDVPSSEVYLWVGGEDDVLIGKIHACSPIEAKYYTSYDIPEDAIDACGGWFAGGGDYYYSIRYENSIEVYAGWQDEMQMEDDDTTFHWGLDTTIVYK